MPEGVEVRISAETIKPLVQNRIIEWIEFPPTSRYQNEQPEGFKEFAKHFSFQDKAFACEVLDVRTKGKFMYWSIADNWYVFITFGMSGQLSPQRGKHVCMKIALDDAPLRLYFNDPRHFGTIKFIKGKGNLDKKLNELGWDPLIADFAQYKYNIINKIRGSTKTIAQLLMDQSIFAGVGNYIKSESLYDSQISPWRLGNSLSIVEIESLCAAIINVMRTSYIHQGATIKTYKTIYGERGTFSNFFKVYGRKSDPKGNKIISETTPDKRTTHWVPDVQK
jgi:formamidopyrimidine-DNA glycosylase